jgi:cytochrome c peroxidase
VKRAIALALIAACAPEASVTHAPPIVAATASGAVNPRLLRRFKPVRDELVDGSAPSRAQIDLGRMLFFDARLSRDRDVSCNSCHALDSYGVDGKSRSVGTGGTLGQRNAPTVFHAAGAIANFWDGRAANVEAQAKSPILGDAEMDMPSAAAVERTLRAIPGYVDAFRAAFPGQAITLDNVDRALGAFERGLVTPSRWDRYLAGDLAALTRSEIAGLKTFSDAGCITCHTGELVGASMFQKVGIAAPWPSQRDRGRAQVTELAADDMVFRVPSLRDVARTAPYFHDGSVANLSDAVRLMARYQLGEEVSDDEVAAIVAWLGTLTGELPATYIARPELPPDVVVNSTGSQRGR